VTLFVYAVLYLTPGTLRVRIVETQEGGLIERNSGQKQIAEADMTLVDGDCLTAGTHGATLFYSAERDRPIRLGRGERHCVGGIKGVPLGYFHWLTKAVNGNLGYYYSTPVTQRLWTATGRTLSLVVGALALSLFLALALVLAEVLSPYSHVVSYCRLALTIISGLHVIVLSFALIGLQWAIPNTGFTLWLIVILAVGNGTFADYHAILREQVSDVLKKDYVQAARGRGANPIEHAIRNEMIVGLLEATSSRVPTLIGGTIVIEWVFSYLGLGYDIVKAIQDRHFELIMGVTLVVAIVLIGVLEVSALGRRMLDPRLRGQT